MRMPGMDGMEVLRALKQSDNTANIPVITMTANPDSQVNVRAQVLALGASDFVAKPFDLDRLAEEIRLFLSR
jgi:CheY-like chemotaxis protein